MPEGTDPGRIGGRGGGRTERFRPGAGGPSHATDPHRGVSRDITRTNRDKINVCPGLIVQWRMPVDEAALLDARSQLEARVRAALMEGAAALGLRLPIG